MDYTIVDIETTGLSAYRHNITEIAAFKYKDGKILDEFSTLINPEVPIPRFITRLTGINDNMVKDAPLIGDIIPKFDSFLSDSVFVGHNAGFDFNFLDHANKVNLDKNLENEKLCTCRLARRLLPSLPSKKLSALRDHFKLNTENTHRAKSDALATLTIFHKFLDDLRKKEIIKVEDILNFQKSKIPKTL